jgi:hypothetical protein
MKRHALSALLLLLTLTVSPCGLRAAAQDGDDGVVGVSIARGELAEIRDKRRVLLLVSRSLSVDVRGALQAVLDEVFGESPRPAPRHQYAYDQIAKKFERYGRDYRPLALVETLDEADFVVVYKAVAEHRSYSPEEPFVFGEMYVFLKSGSQPVLLWRTKGDRVTPGDAAGDFIKALKAVRGER